MNRILHNLTLKQLCPEGTWHLTNVIKTILRLHISRLPKNKVSENETRYPQSPAGMRAFLIKFFTRHYLQTQNSLVTYMTSEDFINIVKSGHLRILDVGSGPAVASIAITDTLSYILKNLKERGEWPKGKIVNVDYIVNDTSSICLGTGKHIIADYFRISRRSNNGVSLNHIIDVQKSFPENFSQLQRIKSKAGSYNIVIFSYIANVLVEKKGFTSLVNGILGSEKLCCQNGRIFILQDKFQEALIKRVSKAIGIFYNTEESTQEVYPNRDTNETYTYSYYSCLYDPTKKSQYRFSAVA